MYTEHASEFQMRFRKSFCSRNAGLDFFIIYMTGIKNHWHLCHVWRKKAWLGPVPTVLQLKTLLFALSLIKYKYLPTMEILILIRANNQKSNNTRKHHHI